MYTTWALTRADKCVLLDEAFYNYVVDRSGSIMNIRLAERRFGDEIPFWKEQIGYLYGLPFLQAAFGLLCGFSEQKNGEGGKTAGRRIKRGKE